MDCRCLYEDANTKVPKISTLNLFSAGSPQCTLIMRTTPWDLEQIDEYDIDEMDLKWQVAMISMRMKDFTRRLVHFARESRIKGTQDHRRRDAQQWEFGNKDGSRTRQKEDSKALVTVDGEGVDWITSFKKMQIML
ncbi:hypothetical protein Tco_0421256 [Tanacetum coccineum]